MSMERGNSIPDFYHCKNVWVEPEICILKEVVFPPQSWESAGKEENCQKCISVCVLGMLVLGIRLDILWQKIVLLTLLLKCFSVATCLRALWLERNSIAAIRATVTVCPHLNHSPSLNGCVEVLSWNDHQVGKLLWEVANWVNYKHHQFWGNRTKG